MGSSGEEEGTRSGFVWDKGLGEVGADMGDGQI